MSEHDQSGTTPPPPGWQPPAEPPPPGAAPSPGPPPSAWAQPAAPYPVAPPAYAPAPGGWAPMTPEMPGMPGLPAAAHRPGAVPLRPLRLGDIFDGAFRIIRFNPRATVGSAALVGAVAMVIPIVVTAILTATLDLSMSGSGLDSLETDGDLDTSSIVGIVASFGSLGLGLLLAGFGTLFVTGMVAHVTAAAAIGRRLSLGEAWAATRGKRWRLIGLTVVLAAAYLMLVVVYVALWVLVVVASHENVAVIVIWGLVSVPVVLAFLIWFWVRVYYLPVPALMLEPIGVFGAVRRAFALTRRQFWRTLGIALLAAIVVGIAGQVIGLPVGIVGQIAAALVGDRYTVLALVVTQAVTQVVTLAFTTPFTSAVTSLQYLDQRMRKEAYDVELMQQAGITA